MRVWQRLIALVRIDAKSLDEGPLCEALGATGGAAVGVDVIVPVGALGVTVGVLDGDSRILLLPDA